MPCRALIIIATAGPTGMTTLDFGMEVMLQPRMVAVTALDTAVPAAYGFYAKKAIITFVVMARANQTGWTVISMKDDWSRIFPSNPPSN